MLRCFDVPPEDWGRSVPYQGLPQQFEADGWWMRAVLFGVRIPNLIYRHCSESKIPSHHHSEARRRWQAVWLNDLWKSPTCPNKFQPKHALDHPSNPPKYGCCAKIVSKDSADSADVLAVLAGLTVSVVPLGVAVLLGVAEGVAEGDFEASGLETSSTVTGPSLHSSTWGRLGRIPRFYEVLVISSATNKRNKYYTVTTLLLHCYYTVTTLLLHCYYTVTTLLLHYESRKINADRSTHSAVKLYCHKSSDSSSISESFPKLFPRGGRWKKFQIINGVNRCQKGASPTSSC